MGLSFLANPSRNRRYLSVNSKNLCPSCSHSLFGRSSIQSIISRAILFLSEAMIYPRYLTLQACHANVSGVLIRLYYGNCWSTSMTVLVYFSFDSEQIKESCIQMGSLQSSISVTIVFMPSWNVAGLFTRPKGITVYSLRQYLILNTVIHLSPSWTQIRQNPA